ncbi:hypothetical protein G7A66_06680 [Altererythrobacter sp. SALINAS58]|nr:hypothetical protein [Alteripontixanthobacter muriae]
MRRGPAEHLRDALAALAQHHATFVRHSERAWASITFTGARHSVELFFDGADAVAAGEEFVACLPDHEFTIRGQIVAEANVTSVDHTLLPAPRMEVSVEVLMLDDK